jgi:hypothetical protein
VVVRNGAYGERRYGFASTELTWNGSSRKATASAFAADSFEVDDLRAGAQGAGRGEVAALATLVPSTLTSRAGNVCGCASGPASNSTSRSQ